MLPARTEALPPAPLPPRASLAGPSTSTLVRASLAGPSTSTLVRARKLTVHALLSSGGASPQTPPRPPTEGRRPSLSRAVVPARAAAPLTPTLVAEPAALARPRSASAGQTRSELLSQLAADGDDDAAAVPNAPPLPGTQRPSILSTSNVTVRPWRSQRGGGPGDSLDPLLQAMLTPLTPPPPPASTAPPPQLPPPSERATPGTGAGGSVASSASQQTPTRYLIRHRNAPTGPLSSLSTEESKQLHDAIAAAAAPQQTATIAVGYLSHVRLLV
jgi:hypothetical protein